MSPALIQIIPPNMPQQQQPQPKKSTNPNLFNFSDISSNTSQASHSNGASPLPSFDFDQSRSASARSMPRLMKVRKHGAGSAHRGRSRSNCEAPPEGSNEGNALQELRDRYRSWNPFPGGGLSSSGSSVSGDFELPKVEDGGVVFGAGASCSSSASNSVSGSSSFLGESLGNEGAFVFRSASRMNSGGLDDELGKLNIKGLRANSGLDDEMGKLNMKRSNFDEVVGRSKDSGFIPKTNAFVFTGNVASAFDEGADTKLQDELKKMNIGGDKNVGGFERGKDGKFSTKVFDDSFVFRSNKKDGSSLGGCEASVLSEEMKKVNLRGAGVGGRDEEGKGESFNLNRKSTYVSGSKKEDGHLSGSTVNILPDEIRKLNIRDPGDCSAKVFPSSTVFEKYLNLGKSSESSFHEPVVGSSITGESSNSSVPQKDDYIPSAASVPLSSFSSSRPSFQSATNVFEVPSASRAGNKSECIFGSRVDGLGTPSMEFKTPLQDTSQASIGNLFSSLNQKLEFSATKGTVKDSKVKKKRGKSRRPASLHQPVGQSHISRESSSQENPESPGHYSPMDFSPYQETLVVEQSSRDTSVTSGEYFNLDGRCPSTDPHGSGSIDAIDEDLIAATESLKISKNDRKSGDSKEERSRHHFGKGIDVECPPEEFVTKAESECSESKTDEMDIRSDTSAAAESEAGKTQFFASSFDDSSGSNNFTFAASTSAQAHMSSAKRHQRKKNRLKAGQDSSTSTNAKMQFGSPSLPFFPLSSNSSHLGFGESQQGDSSISQSQGENKAAADKEVKQGFISNATAILAAQEACEKWRLRGNQAYSNGNSLRAEEYYTRGVNCVSVNETSKSCLNALVLCYSNRAAARMSAGRMREALWDCTKAAEIDPNFVKVQVRAANCHLALGEVEDAMKYFKTSLPSGADVCLDRKIVIEASNGLQKAQQVADYLDRCAELLRHGTSDDAEIALRLITEALSISPYSEKLVEMKAEAFFTLRQYDEVIQLCEQSVDSAEKNSPPISAASRLKNLDDSEIIMTSPARLWRWRLVAKSNFYLGRLEEALIVLEKLEQEECDTQKFGSKTQQSSTTLAVTIRELLRHKAAGNEAFQSGRHSEAVEHYTSALSCNIESHPFAAICFCNRAAAYQALGQITDAIADCSLAIALDGNYIKAISRRSTLHEMIRDYGQAVVDLHRLVSILEKQAGDKSIHPGTLGRSNSSIDLRQVSLRLSSVEEEAKRGTSLNFYLILGIESSGTASDIKKAYRKAALRHHPDKAGQFLARNENGDDRLWKEIAEEVHKDADRLFKMIGEAYAVVSDPTKRSQYDSEEIRIAKKKGNECSTSRASSDYPNYPFERSGSRRHWQETRRSYRNRSPQW